MMMTFSSRRSRAVVALAAALTLATAGIADARVGGGSSSGSRGGRTFSAPASTPTAPTTARPMERSMAQPGPSMQRPGAAGQVGAPSRGLGFGGGLMAGLLGAGLLGMFMGHGFFGGLAGIASIFGLLLQVGLVVGLAYLAVRWFRRRQEPAFAGPAGGPSARSALGGMFAGGGGGSAGPRPQAQAQPEGRSDAVGIGPSDYSAFEEALGAIQAAYGREDLSGLRGLVTPEMASYFADDLAANASRGVVNQVSDVKLLQGDLAESWREGSTDYATLAMRFSLVDVTIERASGRVVEGSRTPVEATELWTFRRERGGRWLLSAIQQTA
jgi:predicted lipid-binding transport protein (Tim44 family)